MIPLRDENPTRTTPFVNHALVGINIAVFVYQVTLGYEGGQAAYMGFVEKLAVTPSLLLSPSTWAQTPIPAPLTLLTSMFVHGSILHLAGNMLYLWIFGDNVEDILGKVPFVLFYLAHTSVDSWAGCYLLGLSWEGREVENKGDHNNHLITCTSCTEPSTVEQSSDKGFHDRNFYRWRNRNARPRSP